MRIYEAEARDAALIDSLLRVWEESVRATHFFLSDAEIERIKEYVPQALTSVEHLVVAEKNPAVPVGFMGTEGNRLEMLFLSPDERGKGLGKLLLQQAIRDYGIHELTVNEQNLKAAGFYEHMGFATYKRTDRDEQGGPYPLLYMRKR